IPPFRRSSRFPEEDKATDDTDKYTYRRIVNWNQPTTSHQFDHHTAGATNSKTRLQHYTRQNATYFYDQADNITHITHGTTLQQPQYFSGSVVEPHTWYTYDATYRLIQAKGREHIGQLAPPQATDDELRIQQPHPNDGQAIRNYTEEYMYDVVGNLLE